MMGRGSNFPKILYDDICTWPLSAFGHIPDIPSLLSVDVLNGRTSSILNQMLQYCQAYEAQR